MQDVMDAILINQLIEELEKGKKRACMMRNMILEHHNLRVVKLENDNDNVVDDDYCKALDYHSKMVLESYGSSLSMLKTHHYDHRLQRVSAGKRRVHHVKHDVDVDVDVDVDSLSDNGRPHANKRRKKEESKEEVTQLTDDGYGWRKYGQKKIHNHPHPRNYYRCTHKEDQKCEATKHVQQISTNPTKYKIVYRGDHTCNDNILLLHNTTPFTIDSQQEPEQQQQSSSSAIVISFDNRSINNNKVHYPLLFPTLSSSAAAAAAAFPAADAATHPVKSENHQTLSASSIEESSNHVCVEKCSSTVTSNEFDDDDFSSIMAEFPDLLPASWWTSGDLVALQ